MFDHAYRKQYIETLSKIICQFPDCKKECDGGRGFGNHLKYKHDGISRQQYAKDFKTEEWVSCPVCGDYYFRHFRDQYLNKARTCGQKECMDFMKREAVTKSEMTNLTKYGVRSVFQLDWVIELGKQKIQERKENGDCKIASRKAADKMIADGTYKIIVEKRQKWNEENPDKIKSATEKANQTKEDRDSAKIGAHKAADKMIADGTYIENAIKLKEWIKNHPEEKKESARKAADTKNKKAQEDPEYQTNVNSCNVYFRTREVRSEIWSTYATPGTTSPSRQILTKAKFTGTTSGLSTTTNLILTESSI